MVQMKTVGRVFPLLLLALAMTQGAAASSVGGLARTMALQSEEVNSNTALGIEAGVATVGDTQDDTSIGYQSGKATTTGHSNTFIGSQAGKTNTIGSFNTYVGKEAGANAIGSSNVFLGGQAGMNEMGSEKLIISNNASNPLIAGDFLNKTLTINGNLTAIGPSSGVIRLGNTTDPSTDKAARMVLLDHNTPTPNYLFGAFTDVNSNFVAFGGGAPVANAATQVDIFTAPTKGQLGGLPRLTVLGNGRIGIGTQAPT